MEGVDLEEETENERQREHAADRQPASGVTDELGRRSEHLVCWSAEQVTLVVERRHAQLKPAWCV